MLIFNAGALFDELRIYRLYIDEYQSDRTNLS